MDESIPSYDIAIIGGGLGGLTLSIQCARAGYKTVLFEKENYPFHKVCGEYISIESYAFLENLGLHLKSMQLPFIKKLELTDIQGNIYSFDLPLGGFGISRFTLDKALADIAVAEGVELQQSAKVTDIAFTKEIFTLKANGKTYDAKLAVGSFGKRSNIDLKLHRSFITQKPDKLNNWIGVKYHVKLPHPAENITLHNFHNGYCGISRIEDNKCCLCYLTTAENLSLSGNSVKALEQNVLYKNPHLQQVFNQAEFLYDAPLTISQISFAGKTQIENHMLLVGDAASLITPLCGNGMSMAMHAGKIAFNKMDRFLKSGISREQMERQYEAEWSRQFGKRLWVGRTVQSMFGKNSSTTLFLKAMNQLPWLAKKVIAATHGQPF